MSVPIFSVTLIFFFYFYDNLFLFEWRFRYIFIEEFISKDFVVSSYDCLSRPIVIWDHRNKNKISQSIRQLLIHKMIDIYFI